MFVATLMASALCVGQVRGYEEAHAEALRNLQPLVVGVSCAPPSSPKWVTAMVRKLADERGPSVEVSVPWRGPDGAWFLWWRASLSPTATIRDVTRIINDGPLMKQDEAKKMSSHAGLELVPYYMEPYKSAEYTQRIAVTNGRDSIVRIPRRNLELRWQVPGGFVGVKGWRSDLYKWAPHELWVGNISVWNGSNFQSNRGWKRSYDDGTEFMEVFTNTDTGKVFEVRKAEKKNGAWHRFVDFRDAKQRPAGYVPVPAADCRTCHSEAGTGGYATGLVPGGDTVISDPFPALEGGQPQEQKQGVQKRAASR